MECFASPTVKCWRDAASLGSCVYHPHMSRICASCGAPVDRSNCHKNRYSEYICRRCQTEGIRFGPRGRKKRLLRWVIPALLSVFVIACLLALALWLHLLQFGSFSFFETSVPEVFDRRAGTSLNKSILKASSDKSTTTAGDPR